MGFFGSAYPQVHASAGGTQFTDSINWKCQANNGHLSYYANGTAASNFVFINGEMKLGEYGFKGYISQQAVFFRFVFMKFGNGAPGANTEQNIYYSPVPPVLFTPHASNSPTGNAESDHCWFLLRSTTDTHLPSSDGGLCWLLAKDTQRQSNFLWPFQFTGPISLAT